MKEEKMLLIMKHTVCFNLAWQWRYLTDKTGFLFIGTHCTVSQTLTRPHPGPPRRCGIVLSLKFSWRRIIKQSCKVSIVPGAIPGFADDHDDVEQRLISKNDWYVYNFHSQFIFGCYSGEKRLVSTLRLVHHSHQELAVSHSRRAAPAPASLALRGRIRGWRLTCVSVEAADHQCWLVVLTLYMPCSCIFCWL